MAKSKRELPAGLVHAVPPDMHAALTATAEITALWQDLTAIGRNEFLCWVEDAKRQETRARRIQRTIEELLDGRKRPCCWAGCIHRTDKKPGKWQQAVLIDRSAKS
ncbi:YdeI/OmpD-associated family protein [Pseudohoeflea coraliihabitans]|uniref:YdeI/OmpD-associated family protein n=1 Tax=Pseudohoeflea coraliihabitans TaxID=2860393 RepID=A0ABS6WPL2_9HYPH|nr:YdeI/OmpD-associated family protein [Pseudohoeflea sp. DP4N28-3]MBW3097020.1 YdeI/OmpD-associated family protein [Pseudohoeflea sp. DP4N28-3]